MGMRDDDEDAIREDHDLLEWAKNMPKPLDPEYPHSEDEQAIHDWRVKEHLKKKPRRRNPYDKERR